MSASLRQLSATGLHNSLAPKQLYIILFDVISSTFAEYHVPKCVTFDFGGWKTSLGGRGDNILKRGLYLDFLVRSILWWTDWKDPARNGLRAGLAGRVLILGCKYRVCYWQIWTIWVLKGCAPPNFMYWHLVHSVELKRALGPDHVQTAFRPSLPRPHIHAYRRVEWWPTWRAFWRRKGA